MKSTTIFLQNKLDEAHRMYQQLVSRRVDVAGMFSDNSKTAMKWNNYYKVQSVKYPENLITIEKKSCLIVFGVGNGLPVINLLKKQFSMITEIILIDSSNGILELAKQNIKKTMGEIKIVEIVANFILDFDNIANFINKINLPKLFLCLGYTAGNYQPDFIMNKFNQYLHTGEHIVLELGLINSVDELPALTSHYSSEQLCKFALQWMDIFHYAPNYQLAFSSFEKKVSISQRLK